MVRRESKEIRVARINARQAIIVAVISAAAAIGATLVGTGILGAKSPTQHWLRILNVDLDGQFSQIRVMAEVNGRGLSYPTRALWAEPGPEMSSEVFAIEKSDQYQVRLEVLALNGKDSVTRFMSQRVDTINAQQLPVENVYELHEVGGFMTRAGPVSGRVKYSLSDQSQ